MRKTSFNIVYFPFLTTFSISFLTSAPFRRAILTLNIMIYLIAKLKDDDEMTNTKPLHQKWRKDDTFYFPNGTSAQSHAACKRGDEPRSDWYKYHVSHVDVIGTFGKIAFLKRFVFCVIYVIGSSIYLAFLRNGFVFIYLVYIWLLKLENIFIDSYLLMS